MAGKVQNTRFCHPFKLYHRLTGKFYKIQELTQYGLKNLMEFCVHFAFLFSTKSAFINEKQNILNHLTIKTKNITILQWLHK